MKLPFLISVPHAGVGVPEEVRDACVLTPRQIAEDGDEWAAEIYTGLEGAVERFLTTDVARAIVDLNRAEDDRRADGVIKTHTCWNVPVYDRFPDEAVIEMLLDRYHRPYHRALVSGAGSGVVAGIDCHTMLAVGPPIGPMAGEERPRFCLGNVEGKSCPPEMLETLARAIQDTFGIEPALNDPFKGGYITRTHSSEMPWIQIEMSRAPFLTNEEKGHGILESLRLFASKLKS